MVKHKTSYLHEVYRKLIKYCVFFRPQNQHHHDRTWRRERLQRVDGVNAIYLDLTAATLLKKVWR